jgi:hypothetical protein
MAAARLGRLTDDFDRSRILKIYGLCAVTAPIHPIRFAIVFAVTLSRQL